MQADGGVTDRRQQPHSAERRQARWSEAEGRRAEPAGPRPGLYRGLVHERPGFRPGGCISPFGLPASRPG